MGVPNKLAHLKVCQINLHINRFAKIVIYPDFLLKKFYISSTHISKRKLV